MLAVVNALEHWRCYLLDKPFVVLTDHHPNTFFNSKPQLTNRQARWYEKISSYNFDFEYKPGSINVADPLSRMQPHAFAELLNFVGKLDTKRCAQLHAVTRSSSKRHSTDQQNESDADVSDPPAVKKPRRAGKFSKNKQFTPAPSSDTAAQSSGANDLTPLEQQIARAYKYDAAFDDNRFVSGLTFHKGLYLTKRGQVYVPNDFLLYKTIIHEAHDVLYRGHLGVTKTLHAVRSRYFWPHMQDMINEYVTTCPSCQAAKAKPIKQNGLLQPLEIPTRPWSHVSVDLITGLPVTPSGFDAILVWVDILTKMVHFVPTTKSAGAMDYAKIYVNEIFKHHGVMQKFVSDRGTQFNCDFWRELHGRLGSQLALSTAYHAQTDGQTERANRVLEEMLRHFVGPLMNDWDAKLPMLQFAYNSSYNESIQTVPFMLYTGLIPLSPLSTIVEREMRVPAAQQFHTNMLLHLKRARMCIEKSKKRAQKHYDERKKEVEYIVGEKVLLSTAHLQLKTVGTRKLLPKFVGPFEIVARVGKVAYRLKLPEVMKCHDVFHVSLIAPYRSALTTSGADKYGRFVAPPLPLEVDGELEYHVEAILDDAQRYGKKWYLVKWLGFGPEHNSWEPEAYVADLKALDEYEQRL
jgi:hypothetical protein